MESATVRPARRRGSALGLAVSAISLAAVVWWAAHQTAPHFPSSVSALVELLGSLALYAIATLVRGARWSTIIHRAGIACRRSEPYALTVVGYMGNTVLPLRGGEILRVVLLTDRSSAGWRESVGSIVPERVLDVAALAILLGAVTIARIGGAPVGDAPAIVHAALPLAAGGAGGTFPAARA